MTKIEELYLQLETYPNIYHRITVKILDEALEYVEENDQEQLLGFRVLVESIIDIFNPFFQYDIDLLKSLVSELRDLYNQNKQLT